MKNTKRDKSEIANTKKKIFYGILIGLAVSAALFILNKDAVISLVSFWAIFVLIMLYHYLNKKLKDSAKIKKMEGIFPEFLQLMASNLRAGMTVSRAMLLSSREEFAPLDGEIMRVGKDITTGKDIESALSDMSKRIGSEKINKTISLIISGIKSGGDLATLLEETAVNIKEREFIEKKSASSVLMYTIFIFFTVAIGAPALFSLSSVLVEILSKLLSNIPAVTTASVNVPFTLSKINISVDFIKYYCIAFMLVIDVLASLVLGLIGKGEEKEGLKYLIPLMITGVCIFFLMRVILLNFLGGFF
jgi:hypothetical protein